MALTPYYGLSYFGGSDSGSITDDGSKYTSADRLAVDRMLHTLAVSTRHRTGTEGELTPGTPTLTLGTDGGGLPGGATYTYCVTYLDVHGLESLPSEEVTISTPGLLDSPGAPTINATDGIAGALPRGLYYYMLTAVRGDEESVLGAQTSITLDLVGGVELGFPDLPAGATAFQVWRMNANDVGWTRIEVVNPAVHTTWTDDGSVLANRNADDPAQQPPLTNVGLASYSVTIEINAADFPLADTRAIAGWNVYRTETPTAYPATSLVYHLSEVVSDDEDDVTDPLAPLPHSFVDDGDPLLDGVPPMTSRQLQIAPYVLDHADGITLPSATNYPEYYPLVFQGRLYARISGAWVRLSDVDTGDGSGGSGGGSGGGIAPIFYIQDVAATTWTVTYEQEGIPQVTLYDADTYDEIEADVHVDVGVTTVNFAIPTRGIARVSFN